MTQEERNLEAVQRWMHLYNTDVHRMVDESYAKDSAVYLMGVLTMKTPEQTHADDFHGAEAAILKAAPDRQIRVERTLAKDDTVMVEGLFFGTDKNAGKKWEVPFCAVLTFRDGKIVLDHTYLDRANVPLAA